MTSEALTAFVPHEQLSVRRSRSLRLVKTLSGARTSQAPLVIAVRASELCPEIGGLVREARRQRRLAAVLVRADVSGAELMHRLHTNKVQLTGDVLVHSDPAVPERLLHTLRTDHPERLIVHAMVVGDDLVAVSGTLERLTVPMDRLAPLRSSTEEERADFELDADGSTLHWPGPDVHLDLEALQAMADPAVRRRQAARRAVHDQDFGAAVARLRRERGLTQGTFEGLSERQVRRIEKGQTFPRMKTLKALARGLSMDLDELLAAVARQSAEQ